MANDSRLPMKNPPSRRKYGEREDADTGVVRADMRHVGGKADQHHDEQAEAAAAFFHQVEDEVTDINEKQAGGFLAANRLAECDRD